MSHTRNRIVSLAIFGIITVINAVSGGNYGSVIPSSGYSIPGSLSLANIDYSYLSSSNGGYANAGYSNPGNPNVGTLSAGSSNTGYSNTGYSNTGYSNAGTSNVGTSNVGYPNTGYSNSGYSNKGYSNPTPVKPPCAVKLDCSGKREDVTFATDNTTCYVFYNECYLYNENCDRQNRNVAELTQVRRSQCTPLCRTSCTSDYQPVCAVYKSNKQEFANACVLSREICLRGIPYQFLNVGKCPSITPPKPNYGPNYGSNYGTNSGSNYGSNYGTNSGSNYGTNSGSNYGTNYGTNSGSNYGSKLGY